MNLKKIMLRLIDKIMPNLQSCQTLKAGSQRQALMNLFKTKLITKVNSYSYLSRRVKKCKKFKGRSQLKPRYMLTRKNLTRATFYKNLTISTMI